MYLKFSRSVVYLVKHVVFMKWEKWETTFRTFLKTCLGGSSQGGGWPGTKLLKLLV